VIRKREAEKEMVEVTVETETETEAKAKVETKTKTATNPKVEAEATVASRIMIKDEVTRTKTEETPTKMEIVKGANPKVGTEAKDKDEETQKVEEIPRDEDNLEVTRKASTTTEAILEEKLLEKVAEAAMAKVGHAVVVETVAPTAAQEDPQREEETETVHSQLPKRKHSWQNSPKGLPLHQEERKSCVGHLWQINATKAKIANTVTHLYAHTL